MSNQTTPTELSYKRVMLKISGEALMGDQGFGLNPPTVERIAKEVKRVNDLGIELCLVIGGGNIFRGLQGSAQGMERTTADYMGMLATVMNALGDRSRQKTWPHPQNQQSISRLDQLSLDPIKPTHNDSCFVSYVSYVFL